MGSRTRLRFLARLNPAVPESVRADAMAKRSFVPMEAIGEDWTLDLSRSRPVGEVLTGYSYFEDGDIAFAKVTPCFENGKAAIMRGLTAGEGFGTTELTVVRPRRAVSAEFLFYVLNEDRFKQLGVAEMTGAGGLKRVPDRVVRDFEVDLPTRAEQDVVVRFLDRETAEIDAFIADQEELIGLLTERRAATITHAVTKGLDPSVPMKDSGVEWLGAVPATWALMSPRRVFKQRKDLAAPSDAQLAATQEYGVIPQDRYTELTGYRVTQVLKGFEILKHVEPGDFVISMRSFQGGLEYAHHAGKISSAYVMLHPQISIVDRYFRYLFKSSGFIAALRSTSNLVRDGQAMRFSNVAQVQIPIPNLGSQAKIAEYLDHETAELDATIADAREAIALSKERRAALISAAVTGKIDVRGLA